VAATAVVEVPLVLASSGSGHGVSNVTSMGMLSCLRFLMISTYQGTSFVGGDHGLI